MNLSTNKFETISDKAIEYSFYFLAVAVPLVFSPQSYEIFEFPKMLLVYFGAATVLTFWSIKILVTGKLNFAPTVLFWAILAFLGSQILATIFSQDLITSVFGYYSRFNGGLLSTIAFVVLYFGAVSNLKREPGVKILFLLVVAGLVTALWGIPSHFGFDPTCKLITGIWTSECWSADFDPTLRIFSTFGQPNWMAGYLVMAILVLFGLVAASKNFKFQLFGILANSILFWAFLLTNSRSAALALIISLTVFLGILLFLRFREKLSINFRPIITTLLIFALLTLIFGQRLLTRVAEFEIASQTNTTTQQSQSQSPVFSGPTESGQIRLIVWKGAVNIFKNNLITGTGVETFGYSYFAFKPPEHNLTTEWNFLYNKAHNEFLNYAATTGVLGLGSFLGIILLYVAFIIRNTLEKTQVNIRQKILTLSLLFATIAYLIHNFFGFSVVPTALFFWLILASTFLIKLPTVKIFNFKPKKGLLLLPIVFFVFSLFILASFYAADLNFSKGLSKFNSAAYQQAADDFSKAISASPLPQPLFLSYYGYNLSILSQIDKDLVRQAVRLITKSQNLSKVNLTTQRINMNTYFELSSQNPEYIKKTKEVALNLLDLAPTDAETHFQVAQVLKVLGYNNQAENIIKKAIELKPNYTAAIDTLAEWEK